MCQVLQDMLQLFKESASSRHAERLEQIVIALIGIEIGMSSFPRPRPRLGRVLIALFLQSLASPRFWSIFMLDPSSSIINPSLCIHTLHPNGQQPSIAMHLTFYVCIDLSLVF